MAISKESKQALKQQIEVLHAQRKIAQGNLTKFQKQTEKLSARVTEIETSITKLENDLNG